MMEKKQKGHYFEPLGQDGAPEEQEQKRKGRSRKQIEIENDARKRDEKRDREKLRIKREIRRAHIVNHKEGDYSILERWDRESKLAVYALLALKVVLILFAAVEIYNVLVHRELYFFQVL